MTKDKSDGDDPVLSEREITALARALGPVSPPTQRAAALRERVLSVTQSTQSPNSTTRDCNSTEQTAADSIERLLAGSQATTSRDRARTLTANRRHWQALLPGVEICVLRDDAYRRTFLLKMQPGSSLPAHHHRIDEESIILDGSATIGTDLRVGAGDYQFVPAGEPHPVITSAEGCTVLIQGERKPQVRVTPGLLRRLVKHYLGRLRA